MLTLDVKSKRGGFEVNLPTKIDEISESYIKDVTSHIELDDNYTLIGIVYKEKPSAIVLAARKNDKKSNVSVIPIFVKAGKTNSEFIKSLNITDKLIISPSDIMIGYHISAPMNLLTINNFLEVIDGDLSAYNTCLSVQEDCYFIEFKLVPNCAIHGVYKNTDSNIKNPFIVKTFDAPKSDIIIPKINNIVV